MCRSACFEREASREAEAGLRRTAEELVDGIIREHDEIMGTEGYGAGLKRELVDNFLPRYTRTATAHTALEETGFNAWRGGDPVARVVGVILALLFATLFTRAVHHPVAIMAFFVPIFAGLMPELRRWYHRRKYRAALQEIVNDMTRIQPSLDDLSAAGLCQEQAPDAAEAPRSAARPATDKQGMT